MKIFSQGKELSLVSENESERTALAVFYASVSAKTQTPVPVEVASAVDPKPRKKYTVMKRCDMCGRSFQGLKGLHRHITVMHKPTPAGDGMITLPVTEG